MNISYELWPIWCDYLEEQGQNTELLRYVLFYNLISISGTIYGCRYTQGIPYSYLCENSGNSMCYIAFTNTDNTYGMIYSHLALHDTGDSDCDIRFRNSGDGGSKYNLSQYFL